MAERTDIPVVVDDEPELSVALGAALFGDVADLMPGVANVPTPAPMRAEPAPVEPLPVEPPAAPVLRDGVPDPGPLPAPVPPAAPAPVADPFAESPFLAGLRSLGGPPADEPPPGRPLEPDLQADTRPAAPPPPPALPPDPPPSDPPPPPRPLPVPPLRTGEIWPAAVDAGWSDDGHGGFDPPGATDDWPAPEGQWQDTRTSVFEPAPPPAPPAPDAAGAPDDDWGQAPAEAFRRLTTSDTDPFGSWAARDRPGGASVTTTATARTSAASAPRSTCGSWRAARRPRCSWSSWRRSPCCRAPATTPTPSPWPTRCPPPRSPTTEAATSGTAALTSNSTTTSSTTTTTEEDEDEPVTTLPQPTAPPPAPQS